MRKIILGLVATAAIASPLALATAANADSVSTDSTCTPVAAKPATTKTVYKYTPLKSSDGPTQWDTVNAAPQHRQDLGRQGQAGLLLPRRHQDQHRGACRSFPPWSARRPRPAT